MKISMTGIESGERAPLLQRGGLFLHLLPFARSKMKMPRSKSPLPVSLLTVPPGSTGCLVLLLVQPASARPKIPLILRRSKRTSRRDRELNAIVLVAPFQVNRKSLLRLLHGLTRARSYTVWIRRASERKDRRALQPQEDQVARPQRIGQSAGMVLAVRCQHGKATRHESGPAKGPHELNQG